MARRVQKEAAQVLPDHGEVPAQPQTLQAAGLRQARRQLGMAREREICLSVLNRARDGRNVCHDGRHSAPRTRPPIAEPPRLVVNNYPPVISLIEFAAGALKRQSGAAIEFDDFYLAYRERCTAHWRRLKRSRRPMSYAVIAALRSNGKAGNGSWRTCNCQWRKCVA